MKKAISILLGPIHRASCCERMKSKRIHLRAHCAVGFLTCVQLDFSALFSWISQRCAVGFARTVDFWAAKALCLLCISLKEASWHSRHSMHVSVGGGLARTLDNSFNRRFSSSSVAFLGDFCLLKYTKIGFCQLPIKQNKDVLGCGYALSCDNCYVRFLLHE